MGGIALRGHIYGGNGAVVIGASHVQRLVFALMKNGIELIGAVQNGGRAYVADFGQRPGAVFQGSVRQGAGVAVDIGKLQLPVPIAAQYHAHGRHPVIGQIGQHRVVHIVRAAVKEEHGAVAVVQGIYHRLIGTHMVVEHPLHIDPAGLVRNPGAKTFMKTRLLGFGRGRKHTDQQQRKTERCGNDFFHRLEPFPGSI